MCIKHIIRFIGQLSLIINYFDKRMHNYLKDVPIVPKNIVLLKYIPFLSVFLKKEGQLRKHLAYL